MDHLIQIRTHGRLAPEIEVGAVILCPSFHYPFAKVVEIDRLMGYYNFTVERGDGPVRSVRSYSPEARVDVVVSAPALDEDEVVDRWLGVGSC